PGVGGQGFDVPPLPLGEDRVERQAGLPRSGKTGEHDQAVPGEVEIDPAQVVLTGAADDKAVRHRDPFESCSPLTVDARREAGRLDTCAASYHGYSKAPTVLCRQGAAPLPGTPHRAPHRAVSQHRPHPTTRKSGTGADVICHLPPIGTGRPEPTTARAHRRGPLRRPGTRRRSAAGGVAGVRLGPVEIQETYTGHVEPGGAAARRQLDALSITKISVGPMDNNAYLLVCRRTGDGLLIDAADEPERLADLLGHDEQRPRLRTIVTTHRHPDHWQALGAVAGQTGANTVAHPEDADSLPVPPDRLVEHGDTIAVGECELEVIHLRGHTPGSIALLYRDPTGHPH